MQTTTQTINYSISSNDFILDQEKRYLLRIKDLEDGEKPREKLIKFGPNSLSSAELLAIILNTGTRKEDVINMSNRILKEYGEKTIANQNNPVIIEKELHIPLTKACQIVSIFELGKRFHNQKGFSQKSIRTAKQAFEYLKDMGSLPKEHFRALYLNSRYKIIHDEIISVGSLTANIVHPRELFKPALEHSAAAVIIAHNHPSGSLLPTGSDIEVTNKLIAAGKILGIDLIDHIIIVKNKFTSIPCDYCA